MKLQSPLLIGVILLAGFMLANRTGPQPSEGQLAALERSATRQWNVELAVQPDTVTVGDLGIQITIKSVRSGYLTLLQRGTDGKEEVVFPNALGKDNRIEADKPISLPRPRWQWKATQPAGEGKLLAVVSEKPLDA